MDLDTAGALVPVDQAGSLNEETNSVHLNPHHDACVCQLQNMNIQNSPFAIRHSEYFCCSGRL